MEFVKNRILGFPAIKLLARTVMKWQQDECLEMGAALAYYAIFSLFPMILVVLSVVAVLNGPDTVAYEQIQKFAQEALPPDAFKVVETTLMQFYEGSTRASIIGFGILFFTSSGFFGALSRSFDKIWHVTPHHETARNAMTVVLNFLWKRFFAFLLVVSSTSLIFISLISNIAIDTLVKALEQFNERIHFISIDQALLLPWLQLGASFLTLTMVVMVLFKVLPSTRIAWQDIWLGALMTALLWVLLQQLISNSVISLGSRFRSYGVVGGVMVLMLWIYLTTQIFFLGGEFTYVYAHMFGSRRGKKLQPRTPEVSTSDPISNHQGQ